MEGLVDEAFNPDRSKKKAGLEGLLSEVKKTRGCIVISNITRFFIALQECLLESDIEIVTLTLQILQETIPVRLI